jgi:hypothetical protein
MGVAVAEALAQEAPNMNVRQRAIVVVVLHTTCVTQACARAAPGNRWHDTRGQVTYKCFIHVKK